MEIKHVALNPDHLTVTWVDGRMSHFHYLWLRDNCVTGRHPVVGERVSDPLSLPLDLSARDASIAEDGQLEIIWANDGHESVFDPIWLHRNAYEPEAIAARQFQPTLWTSDIAANLPEVTYDSIMADDEGLLTWLRMLRQYGFTIVRGVPTDHGEVAKVAQRIAHLRNSNFGELFNVVSKPDPNSLAYTAKKLTAHTDLVSREAQPGIQFLHCLEFEAEGGESILVDGFAAAEALKRRHPDDYELLVNTPVRFRYQDKTTDITFKSPMIRLDTEGNYFEIRYSIALFAPLDIPFDKVQPFYRAYHNFSHILRDPTYEFTFKLQPGDMEVFDNRRVLHGRAEFDPQSGPRYLEGCYVDMDDFLSRIRVLERDADWSPVRGY